MPLHDMKCENLTCQYEYEVFLWINEEIPTQCPKCEQNTLIRLYGVPINPEIKTVGMFAEKNSRDFSEQTKKDLDNKYRSKNNQRQLLDKGGWSVQYENKNK